MKMKWLTGLYVLFLVLLVFLVDQRQYQFLFRFVRRTAYGDKIGHLLLMGFFSFLLNLALSCRQVRLGRWKLLVGSLVVLLVVTLEEFSQLYVRYRTFDPVDLVFDYLGIFCFGQLAHLIMKKRGQRSEARG